MMRIWTRWALAIAMVFGVAIGTVSAGAETTGVMNVEDQAALFSDDGIQRAKQAFQSTSFHSPTHVLVVTANHVPTEKQAQWDEIVKNRDDKARNRFGEEWARSLGRTKDSHGDVVILIYKAPTGGFFVSTISDKQSDVYRHFSDAKAREIDGIFLRELRKVKAEKLEGEQAKKEMDTALISATEKLISDLKDTSAPSSGRSGASNHVSNDHREGSNIGGYICMFLCVALGIWLVVGLIRAFTGGGGGGYGGPGGYGGGGGGFFSSLLGGMFGTMAGMWMYNSFFGGHSFGNEAMAGENYGGAGDTGDGNYDDGAAATDGDWGDDGGGDFGGGGDWGGGGGDWGGGGDFGGGGDW